MGKPFAARRFFCKVGVRAGFLALPGLHVQAIVRCGLIVLRRLDLGVATPLLQEEDSASCQSCPCVAVDRVLNHDLSHKITRSIILTNGIQFPREDGALTRHSLQTDVANLRTVGKWVVRVLKGSSIRP